MRYSKTHKDRTRRLILDRAATRFRKEGIDAVGIKSLMADAGLTHGGFYAHFRSKEKLVSEALATAFDETFAGLSDAAKETKPGGELEALIASYLSEAHLKHLSRSCPAAALGAEVARQKKPVKVRFTAGVTRVSELIAQCLPEGGTPAKRRQRGLAIFACMSGILQTARALDDADAAKRLLAEGRSMALRLAEADL